jgi:glycosyltransferase involved in cell wall biosynthesis
MEVIHRGVDPLRYHHDFKPSEDWQRSWLADFPNCRGKKTLVLPGRVTRLKGHDDFLRILAEMKIHGLSVHGLIVGGVAKRKEAYGRELQALRDQMGLSDDVTMTGSRDDLREILAWANLSFSLSSQPESFGRTVCEALSLGRPVIGYDHGGVGEQLKELLPEGRVPSGEWKAAAVLATKLLAESPRVAPNNEFLLDRMLEKTLRLYEGLALAKRA